MCPLQFEFQENNSVRHALSNMTKEIRSSRYNRQFVCGIFVDLQKAFHTVNYYILLTTLEHYDIGGNALSWSKFYLYERSQFVLIIGSNSSLMRTMGV